MDAGRTYFLFALAVLLAIVEFEAEGRFGWGQNFPTWYRVTTKPAKWLAIIQKPLTGYHSPLTLFTFGIFVWPMIDTGHVTLIGVVQAFSFYLVWATVWDYSWFLLNPHYGPRNFRRNRVWWFSQEPWLFRLIPQRYIIGWSLSLALATLIGYLDPKQSWFQGFRAEVWQMQWYLIGVFLLGTIGRHFYLRYYFYMRRDGNSHDERDQAGIFPSGVAASPPAPR